MALKVPHWFGGVRRPIGIAGDSGAPSLTLGRRLAAQHKPTDRDLARLTHGVDQQPIGTLVTSIGHRVIADVEVNRVDRGGVDELLDIDRSGSLRSEFFQFLAIDGHVPVPADLEPFNDIGSSDWLRHWSDCLAAPRRLQYLPPHLREALGELNVILPSRGNLPSPIAGKGRGGGSHLDHLLMADSLPTRPVDLVEADVLPASGGVKAHRDADQPEADRPRPYRSRHKLIMAWRLSAGYGRRQSNADGLTRGTGPEVGGPAHGGPLLGFRGTGPGGRLGGFERTGAEQQAQRWLVEAGDPDDQCGSAGRVPGLPAVGRVPGADHPTDGQVVVRTDRHGPRRRATPIGAEGAGLDDGDVDAERFDFAVEDFREAFHGELRGLVGAQAWRPADASTDRRELDEVTRALLAQHR